MDILKNKPKTIKHVLTGVTLEFVSMNLGGDIKMRVIDGNKLPGYNKGKIEYTDITALQSAKYELTF